MISISPLYPILFKKVNADRTESTLDSSLKNNILNSENVGKNGEIFAEGPGGIIDIQVGPDGYMYVLALFQKGSNCDPDVADCVLESNSQIKGAIFRITPATSKITLMKSDP